MDIVSVVGLKSAVNELAAMWGRIVRTNSATDLLTLSAGMVLGLLIGMIQLPIEHAFAGTKPRTASIGVGLPGMQERLRQLGGHLDIHSRQDGGTTIRARVRLTDATTIASTVHDEAPSRTGV